MSGILLILAAVSLACSILLTALWIRSLSHWDRLYINPAPHCYTIVSTAGGSMLILWGREAPPSPTIPKGFYSDPYIIDTANWTFRVDGNSAQFPLVVPVVTGVILAGVMWRRQRKQTGRGFAVEMPA